MQEQKNSKAVENAANSKEVSRASTAMIIILIICCVTLLTFFMTSCANEANKTEGTEVIETEPPVTEPPATEPPVTEPPATEAPTEPPNPYEDTFSSDLIYFESEYVVSEDVMPYALFTPKSDDPDMIEHLEETKKPLLVFLHGAGEVGGLSVESYMKRGLMNIFNNWGFEGFDAYIICPKLDGAWNAGNWNSQRSADNLKAVIDKFVSEHNVDTDHIILSGHSLGGIGAQSMLYYLPDTFCMSLVLSGYNSGADLSGVTCPVVAYTGYGRSGEDMASVNYTNGKFAERFGSENTVFLEATHGNLPRETFAMNYDGDNQADIIQYLFSEFIENPITEVPRPTVDEDNT